MELVPLLFAVGLVVKFWPVIAAVAGMIVAAHLTRRAVDSHIERLDAERRRLAGLVARADRQHRFVLNGDERGVFGEFPPAAT